VVASGPPLSYSSHFSAALCFWKTEPHQLRQTTTRGAEGGPETRKDRRKGETHDSWSSSSSSSRPRELAVSLSVVASRLVALLPRGESSASASPVIECFFLRRWLIALGMSFPSPFPPLLRCRVAQAKG